jgi:hypothetical protein
MLTLTLLKKITTVAPLHQAVNHERDHIELLYSTLPLPC